jgi:hypothetical protein
MPERGSDGNGPGALRAVQVDCLSALENASVDDHALEPNE